MTFHQKKVNAVMHLNYKVPKKEITAVKQVMWNKVDIWLISEKNRLAISE